MVWSKPAVPEKTLAAWLAPIGSPSLREELSSLRASLANTLSPGMPAPDFHFLTESRQQGSLSSFRGKYVYLNFLAGRQDSNPRSG